MASRSLLPLGLVDLTWLRASTELGLPHTARSARPLCLHVIRRKMHQAATAPTLYGPWDAFPVTDATRASIKERRSKLGALAVRNVEGNDTAGELSRRVEALVNVAASEAESAAIIPEFSEDDLLAFYENILALPTDQQESPVPVEASQQEKDWDTIKALSQRLFADAEPSAEPEASDFTKHLIQRQALDADSSVIDDLSSSLPRDAAAMPPHHRVLSFLRLVTPKVEAARNALKPAFGAEVQAPVPVAIMADAEWQSLVRSFLETNEPELAEETLVLMKRSGIVPYEESVNDIMASYARAGDIESTETFMQKFLTANPTDRQRHLHIKAYLRSVPAGTIPTGALEVLHHYENQSLPAPMMTYTNLITSLFSVDSSLAHAQAWDLFAHMRYVAHPDPDALLYTLMIRACASPGLGGVEPERALDLFTEMTVDHGLAPTAGAYSAVILACARSGTKEYINEAFRLAKEMLDAHRDASGRPAFPPEGRTFVALLEGAKRIGDLARVRWILAELVRGSQPGVESGQGTTDAVITEEVMMHVFHAYAAYRPPFRPSLAPLVSGEPTLAEAEHTATPNGEVTAQPSSPEAEVQTQHAESSLPIEASPDASFKHLPPQSRGEVLHEASALFSRIVEDSHTSAYANAPSRHAADGLPSAFQAVQLTPRLLNAYLSVHYAHAALDAAHALFRTLFAEHGVEPNARSYVEALERCAIARRGRERDAALAFADEVWEGWVRLENAARLPGARSVNARMVERAHAAMIRTLALTNQLDRALTHVREFATRYPPSAVREPSVLPPMRSSRTALLGAHPLVRFTSNTEVPDDTVPPLLGFAELEILHHRLVAARRRDAVGYVKYVCKAYEGALRMRRDATMRMATEAQTQEEQ
ncbi:hypothetical protein DENSPDRAFT_830168 [Dentipellis sp. KUC8613]|nr:hypothetical protein DENSPDRAFT_830168 [Dentipellis sp. KUC8613]